MVPTEVLAEQHHISARTLLDGLSVPSGEHLGGKRPVEVALLTSRTPASERSRVHSELKSGRIDLLVGTHALLTETVEFSSLGVVVVDEQHRFGVEQRAALREKGPFIAPRDAPLLEVPQPVERSGDDSDAAPDAHLAGGAPERPVRPGPARAMPDVLVMTATPIPRTAAMTVYGDLDQTVLDELPEGRTPISTIWVDDPGGDGVAWDKVRAELDEGRQAYVICPLVGGGGPEDEEPEEVDLAPDLDGDSGEVGEEEVDGPDWFEEMARSVRAPEGHDLADKGPPRSVTDEVLRLQGEELAGYRLGVLHGQLPTREKEAVMAAFRRGDLQVLVATTVIEVGVDVGNATVMVIEDADRFGMAQLHQLRGRVGRGSLRSWCYLLASDVTAPAARRLEALAGTTDGFALAEVDLALRGEGTVLNIRQKGRSDLRLASLRHDRDLVVAARGVAEAIVGADPLLAAHPLLHDEVRLLVGEAGEEFLSKS